MVVSEAATVETGDEEGGAKVIMINDVARAFFEAPKTREVCVELPEEDKTEEDRKEDRIGLLQMSLYGTRDAAANFQKEVRRFMISQGFDVGNTTHARSTTRRET